LLKPRNRILPATPGSCAFKPISHFSKASSLHEQDSCLQDKDVQRLAAFVVSGFICTGLPL
jgi:hypothetical protein